MTAPPTEATLRIRFTGISFGWSFRPGPQLSQKRFQNLRKTRFSSRSAISLYSVGAVVTQRQILGPSRQQRIIQNRDAIEPAPPGRRDRHFRLGRYTRARPA